MVVTASAHKRHKTKGNMEYDLPTDVYNKFLFVGQYGFVPTKI